MATTKTTIIAIKDKNDFDAKLQDANDTLVVVDFHATWCGPCKQIAPKLEALGTDVIVLKVDVDDNDDIAQFYGISSMPTFVFIRNKVKVEQFSGANFAQLQATVNRLNENK